MNSRQQDLWKKRTCQDQVIQIIYPPTQANKGWYNPFTIVCISKNDRVEVRDHTRWYTKVSTKEIKQLRNYIEGLSNIYEEPDPNGFKCI